MRILRGNETKVALATLILLIYTVTLSVVDSVVRAPFQYNKTIGNAGSVVTIGVGIYWDAEGTRRVSMIDWGTLEPGSNKTLVVYVRNEGNSPANLTMYASNWNPSNASDFVGLSWDREEYPIMVGEIVQATFTLIVSASVNGITTFSFDITVIASS